MLRGWPVSHPEGNRQRFTPAIGDIDGDGTVEIVFGSGRTVTGTYLYAHRVDGTSLEGFPLFFPGNDLFDTYPALGDVDGDGALEIVVVATRPDPRRTFLHVISAAGIIKRSILMAGNVEYETAPALADLDGDGLPEIVVTTEDISVPWSPRIGYIWVLNRAGMVHPAFPKRLTITAGGTPAIARTSTSTAGTRS